MTIIRGYNLLLGSILCLAAFLAAVSIGDGMGRYSEEPEDVWLAAIWAVILAPLAALCLVNGLSAKFARSVWLKGLNLIAASVIFVIVIIGQQDPVIVVCGAIAVLGPLPAVFATQDGAL